MKKYLFALYILCYYTLFTQCPCVGYQSPVVPGVYIERHISEFGGFPDDDCCDHFAFHAAATFFQENGGNGKLILDQGIYEVGEQTFSNAVPIGFGKYRIGGIVPSQSGCEPMVKYMNPFELRNAESFTIEGNNATIKFKDCMYYGRFQINGSGEILRGLNGWPQMPGTNNYCDPNGLDYLFAGIGTIFNFENCNNITLRDLRLNGNFEKTIVGGRTQTDGNQLIAYDGITLINTSNSLIEHVHAKYFGKDGLILDGIETQIIPFNNEAAQSDPLQDGTMIFNNTLKNCEFNYNVRTGIAWTGLAGLRMVNCKANYNSITPTHSHTKSGLDIEYDGPAFSRVRYGVFENCEFSYNYDKGVEVGESSECYGVFDFRFYNCEFKSGENGYTVNPDLRQMYFEGCDFYGRVGPTYFDRDYDPPGPPGILIDEDLKFTNCSFNETDNQFNYLPEVGSIPCLNGAPLFFRFENGGFGRIHFEECHFNLECTGSVVFRGKPLNGNSNGICSGHIDHWTINPSIYPCDINFMKLTNCEIHSMGRLICSGVPFNPDVGILFQNTNTQNVNIYYPSRIRYYPPGFAYTPPTLDNNNCHVSGINNFTYEPIFEPCKPYYKNPLVQFLITGSDYIQGSDIYYGNPSASNSECIICIPKSPFHFKSNKEEKPINVTVYKVYTIDGKLVKSGVSDSMPTSSILTELSPGVYLIQFGTNKPQKVLNL